DLHKQLRDRIGELPARFSSSPASEQICGNGAAIGTLLEPTTGLCLGGRDETSRSGPTHRQYAMARHWGEGASSPDPSRLYQTEARRHTRDRIACLRRLRGWG